MRGYGKHIFSIYMFDLYNNSLKQSQNKIQEKQKLLFGF